MKNSRVGGERDDDGRHHERKEQGSENDFPATQTGRHRRHQHSGGDITENEEGRDDPQGAESPPGTEAVTREFVVEERLTMLNLLPPEGNLITMKIVHELRQALGFSDEEFTALDFKQENGRLMWKEGTGPKEVKVGVKAASIVHDELAKLDKGGTLKEAHLTLCEKFEYEG